RLAAPRRAARAPIARRAELPAGLDCAGPGAEAVRPLGRVSEDPRARAGGRNETAARSGTPPPRGPGQGEARDPSAAGEGCRRWFPGGEVSWRFGTAPRQSRRGEAVLSVAGRPECPSEPGYREATIRARSSASTLSRPPVLVSTIRATSQFSRCRSSTVS